MKVVGRQRLVEFARRHADARSAIESWLAEAEDAQWSIPQDIKDKYAQASILGNNTVVFNLRGNSYRLVVKVAYKAKEVVISRVGTHKEYDTWVL